MQFAGAANYVVTFDHLIEEVNNIVFKIVEVDYESLGRDLGKFVAIGSVIQKLYPDDLTIVANMDGDYKGKEMENLHLNNGKEVPNNLLGLLANGTKYFDAFVYLGMEPTRRPKPVSLELQKTQDGKIVVPTYNDMTKLAKYLIIVLFYILIRGHPPSVTEAYVNQPMPKFMTTVLGCRDNIFDITDYLASFYSVKMDPKWFQHLPTNHISQEGVNRLGLRVAGYRLVSIFTNVEPDLYTAKSVSNNEYRQLTKPSYLDTAVEIMRSFKTAGYCWDFHPATRSPDIFSTYGNINKSASNLMLECYTTETLTKLKDTKRLAVMPVYDPAHTDYKTWSMKMKYIARKRIFPTD
ncbi:hypothetical protein HI914_02090 [Erysiphe necator]|nr:hypothetical protein HI914_02090 [Erysiphe necator]